MEQAICFYAQNGDKCYQINQNLFLVFSNKQIVIAEQFPENFSVEHGGQQQLSKSASDKLKVFLHAKTALLQAFSEDKSEHDRRVNNYTIGFAFPDETIKQKKAYLSQGLLADIMQPEITPQNPYGTSDGLDMSNILAEYLDETFFVVKMPVMVDLPQQRRVGVYETDIKFKGSLEELLVVLSGDIRDDLPLAVDLNTQQILWNHV